ncbi:hypothetical protein, partial [Acinetobacter sp. ESBL14]|uniref:hypothetical protein n=1 Tax=Acinetobacter sp. ESBL14 TaxID=3077329 RepID=UPI002FCC4ABB
YAPGRATVDRHGGAMQYELSNGGAIFDYVSRREVAETIRYIPELENPSDEDLEGFRAYMNPPDVEPPTLSDHECACDVDEMNGPRQKTLAS